MGGVMRKYDGYGILNVNAGYTHIVLLTYNEDGVNRIDVTHLEAEMTGIFLKRWGTFKSVKDACKCIEQHTHKSYVPLPDTPESDFDWYHGSDEAVRANYCKFMGVSLEQLREFEATGVVKLS